MKEVKKDQRKSNFKDDAKSKRRNYKQSKFKDEDYQADRKSLNNDINWYVADNQILQDVASLPFSNVLSSGVTMNIHTAHNGSGQNMSVLTPGIMNIVMQPTYGFGITGTSPSSDAAVDPLNMAAKSIYSFVRKHNSGAANYDEVDLMEYFIAMDNVYMMWSWAARLYGICRCYNFKNRYVPEAILGACGLNATSQQELLSNLAQFRYMLNNFALRMSSLAVPTVMPIIQRHFWLYSNIFQDADDAKAQMFIYNPYSYYVYNEATGNLSQKTLSYIVNSTTYGSDIVARVQYILNDMLDKLLYSQSIGIMSGDVLKAYENNIYSFGTIPEDFTVIPVYNEKILPQIHNLQMSEYIAGNIEQTNNYLYTLYTTNTTNWDIPTTWSLGGTEMLNLPYQNPTPEDVMYATRLHIATALNPDNHYEVYCGSENIVKLQLISNAPDGTLLVTADAINTWWDLDTYSSNPDNVAQALQIYSYWNQFDWAPMLRILYQNSISSYGTCLIGGDLANYTLVDVETIRRIHSAAFCGLYGIPYTLKRA